MNNCSPLARAPWTEPVFGIYSLAARLPPSNSQHSGPKPGNVLSTPSAPSAPPCFSRQEAIRDSTTTSMLPRNDRPLWPAIVGRMPCSSTQDHAGHLGKQRIQNSVLQRHEKISLLTVRTKRGPSIRAKLSERAPSWTQMRMIHKCPSELWDCGTR